MRSPIRPIFAAILLVIGTGCGGDVAENLQEQFPASTEAPRRTATTTQTSVAPDPTTSAEESSTTVTSDPEVGSQTIEDVMGEWSQPPFGSAAVINDAGYSVHEACTLQGSGIELCLDLLTLASNIWAPPLKGKIADASQGLIDSVYCAGWDEAPEVVTATATQLVAPLEAAPYGLPECDEQEGRVTPADTQVDADCLPDLSVCGEFVGWPPAELDSLGAVYCLGLVEAMDRILYGNVGLRLGEGVSSAFIYDCSRRAGYRWS